MAPKLVVVALLASCGNSGSAVHDGAPDDTSSAALVSDDGHGNAITTLPFNSTLVGQSSASAFHLVNRGSVATGTIALSIAGPHANDFLIDNAQTTCAGATLAPSAMCTVVLVFRPLASGPRTATLTFASSPGSSGAIALVGSAPNLRFIPSVVQLTETKIGSATTRTVQLANNGNTQAPIAISVTGTAFSLGGTTCGSMLDADASCDITITVTPDALGPLSANLVVTSNGLDFTAPLTVVGARTLTVSKAGSGSGTITNSTNGINCGPSCSALVTTDVTLTAAPAVGSELAGWSNPMCGNNLTCTIPADVFDTTVTATFVTSGPATVTIMYAGNGPGDTRIRSELGSLFVNCYATCTVPVTAGDNLVIEATTWSEFGGFGANCTPLTSGACRLANVATGNTTVSVTFTKNDRYTRFLPGLPIATAFDADENLIVGTDNGQLVKLSPTGSTIWTQTFSVSEIATGPSGTIYVDGTKNAVSGLYKLNPTGSVIWYAPIPSGYQGGAGISIGRSIAVAGDGAVVSVGSDGLMRWDSTGAVTWSKATLVTIGGVALESDGTVVVARRSGDTVNRTVTGERFAAANGSVLTSPGIVGQEWLGSIAVDSANLIATHNSGSNFVVLSWRTNKLSSPLVGTPSVPTGTCASTTGPVVFAVQRPNNQGWSVRRMDPSGTNLPGGASASLFTSYGFGRRWLQDLACARAGNAYAIAGEYAGFTMPSLLTHSSVGYVQVVDP